MNSKEQADAAHHETLSEHFTAQRKRKKRKSKSARYYDELDRDRTLRSDVSVSGFDPEFTSFRSM